MCCKYIFGQLQDATPPWAARERQLGAVGPAAAGSTSPHSPGADAEVGLRPWPCPRDRSAAKVGAAAMRPKRPTHIIK